ncbi:MAG TPA: hypothetical protein VLH79_13260 [Chthonomonadales bacterium]|nr:hypothetical protein [Chthonomonadales bacterium]
MATFALRQTPRQVRTPRMVQVHAALVLLGAVFLAPWVWLAMTSLKPEADIFQAVLQRRWVLTDCAQCLTHFPFALYSATP